MGVGHNISLDRTPGSLAFTATDINLFVFVSLMQTLCLVIPFFTPVFFFLYVWTSTVI